MKKLLLIASLLLSTLTTVHSQCGWSGVSNATANLFPSTSGWTVQAAGSGTYTWWQGCQGDNYTVSSCGSSFDTQLTFYRYDGSNWISQAYNDDNGPDCGGSAASISFFYSLPTSDQNIFVINRYNCQGYAGSTSAVLKYRNDGPNAPPTPTGGGSSCGTATLVRGGSPAYSNITYYWQNSPTGTSTSLGSGVTKSVTSSGTWYQRARNSCSGAWSASSAGATVTMYSNVSAYNNTSTSAICEGSTKTLSGSQSSSAGSGSWSLVSGSGYISGSTYYTGSISSNSTVRVRYTVTNGPCSNYSDITFTVYNNSGAINSTSTGSICEGSTKTLSGSQAGPGSGSWSVVSGGGYISGSTYYTASISSNSTVRVRYTVTNGPCSNYSDKVFTVYAAPVAYNYTSTSPICENSTKFLNGGNNTSGGSGSWSIVSGGGSISGSTYYPGNITSNTVVSVRYIASNYMCISDASSIESFTVHAQPTITSSGAAMCQGDTRSLTTSVSGTTFSGIGVSGSTFTAPNPGGLSANYTITATNGPCSSSQIITVYGTASITSTAEDLCEGSTRLIQTAQSGGVLSASCGSCLSGNTFTAPTPSSGNSETFTISYTAIGSPCNATTQDLLVFADPSAASAGADAESCLDGAATMSASSPVIGTGIWTWSTAPTYESGSNPLSPTASVSFNGPGTYTGTWTVSNGACGDVANPQTANVVVTSAANNMMLVNNGMTSTAVEVCTEGAWTYYATAAKPDEYLFAINKNGNTFTADVTITDVAGSAPIESIGGQPNVRGTWLLSRYWNASIKSGSITTTVAIRYFIDDAELIAAQNAADAFLASSPLSAVSAVTPLTFFKTQTAAFDPNTDLVNGDFTFTPTYLNIKTSGTTNGLTYYELDGITSFSGGTGGFGVNDGGSSLPVELISFNAKAVDNQYIQLDWATATEINNDGFEVLRSTNGIDFERIAWMDGHGNSTETNEYVFRDHGVNKGVSYYYQLKQIDFDGQYEYFDIKTARLEGQTNFFVGALVPNPSKGNDVVSVNVETASGEVMTVQIFDQIGSEVKKVTYMLFAAENGLDIDISDLVEGTYFLTFANRMGKETRKLVVIK
ncbi:MAG: T9SS type A sorting domain-containing protein [Balneolaceae bacterium]|nr:T9SS type A sorting domain-containing protein [Balneolaceae bacterium]